MCRPEEPTTAKPETDPEQTETLEYLERAMPHKFAERAKPEAPKDRAREIAGSWHGRTDWSQISVVLMAEAIRAYGDERWDSGHIAGREKSATLDVEVARLREEVGKLMDRSEECEREHPPEPEYLAWQAAGKPDVGEVERLREVLKNVAEFSSEGGIVRLAQEALARAAGEEGGSDAK
jgi:hypothetical protein